MRARFVFLNKYSPVIETVEHRTPPRFVRARSKTGWTQVLRPAGKRPVNIRAAQFYDPSKGYRGRLGAKDKARQARALVGA